MLGRLKVLIGVGAKEVDGGLDGIIAFVAKYRGKEMAEADLAVQKAALKKLFIKQEEHENAYKREQADVIRLEARRKDLVAGLQSLKDELAGTTDEAEKTAIETAMNEGLDEVEELDRDLEVERAEAAQAKEIMDIHREELHAAKAALDEMAHGYKDIGQQMKLAEIQKKRAERLEAARNAGAGIGQSAILKAMKNQAEKDGAEARATDMMSEAMAPKPKSDRLAAAIGKAKGEGTGKPSALDRLANL